MSYLPRVKIVGTRVGVQGGNLQEVMLVGFEDENGVPFTPTTPGITVDIYGQWDPDNTYLAGDPLKAQTSKFSGGTNVTYTYVWQKEDANAGQTTWTDVGQVTEYNNDIQMLTYPESAPAGNRIKLLCTATSTSGATAFAQAGEPSTPDQLISAQPFAKDTSWVNVTPNSGGQTVNVGDTITYTTATYDGGTPGYTSYEYYWRLETGNGTDRFEPIDPPGKTDYNNTAINVSLVVPSVESDGTRRIGPRTRAEDSAPYGAANPSEIGTTGIMQFIAPPPLESDPNNPLWEVDGVANPSTFTTAQTIDQLPIVWSGGYGTRTVSYRWGYRATSSDSWTNGVGWQSSPVTVAGNDSRLSPGYQIRIQERCQDQSNPTQGVLRNSGAIDLVAATTIGTISLAPPAATADAGDTLTFDVIISGDASPTYTWSIRSGPASFVEETTGTQVQVQVDAGASSGASIQVQVDAVDNGASDSPKGTLATIIVN